ncbi:MAG TPA: fumarylacetoacetate hydrolase family protein [Ramlibacter sp.]|jgi:2-keto-4-pentenoate hydratase|nr:fumarylacetoacetate hydrolase family protein [Ramlibacter sp.]
MSVDPRALARELQQRHARGARFEALTAQGQRLTLDDAYAVQDAFVALTCGGQRGVGYKIGLTSPAMQAMCGISHPIHGELRGDGIFEAGHAIELARYGRLGLECEIAVRLARALPADRALTRDDVLACCEGVCPAFEMVDDSNADYATLDAASLVADNSWNAGVVLGRWQPVPAALPDLHGVLFLDGEEVDRGRVGDALSHPFDSVLWLAAELDKRGKRLEPGAIVMTGSIVRTRFPEPGQAWSYRVEGLGEVAVTTR